MNAANTRLLGGGGVDGAIRRAAGPGVMEELEKIRAKIGHCPAGQAVVTRAGRLHAQYIIHAVGPVYRGGDFGESELLASCYRESSRLADELAAKSIAFPAISTGRYGYPIEEAAGIAIREVRVALQKSASLQSAQFVLFDEESLQTFLRIDRNL